MIWLERIWKPFRIVLILFAVMIIISFASSRQDRRYINDVEISVDNQFENHFISQRDVLTLINSRGKDYLLGSDFQNLNLKEIEDRVESHQFVNDAQAYVDLKGNLSIDVTQNRPIARVLVSGGSDYYIGMKGDLLPESKNYTARVLLVQIENSGWVDSLNINNSEQGRQIFELLQFISNDDFWRAQVSGIQVDNNQEVILEPQVTKQQVVFGHPEDIEQKFNKLMTFYKKILPYKGWNTYSTVNLKFKNQIVCK